MEKEFAISVENKNGVKKSKTYRRRGIVYDSPVDQILNRVKDLEPPTPDESKLMMQTMNRGVVANGLIEIITSTSPNFLFYQTEKVDGRRGKVLQDAPIPLRIAQDVIEEVGLTRNIAVIMGEPLEREKINETIRNKLTEEELSERRKINGLQLISPIEHTPELERALKKIVVQAEKTKEEYTERNIKFVAYALQKKGLGYSDYFSDLFSAANEGLLRAVEKYDWRRGYTFTTYAEQIIIQHATREFPHLRGERSMMAAAYSKITNASNELYRETGIWPSVDEIAAKSEIDVEEVEAILKEVRISRHSVSLDEPISEDNRVTYADITEGTNDPRFSDVLQQQDVKRIFASAGLSNKEADVYVMHVVEGTTFRDIGKLYGLNEKQARRLWLRAEVKLKRVINVNKPYFAGE